MAKELFLEIGTEEIPAAFLPKALKDLEELIRKAFDDGRISYGAVTALGTPRRLALCVADVAEDQEDQIIEKFGPAKNVAFDAAGTPSKAAVGFARGQGLEVTDLETVVTDKGEYLCARKTLRGGKTADLLPDMLTKLIVSIPFRKSMRWADFDLRFARPIHWIVALFGGDTVPFQLENIASGNRSFGHRFMSPTFFEVENFRDYLEKARAHYIIVDPAERRRIILAEAAKAAAAVGGTPLAHDALLEQVTFLVEYPSAVCGSFSPDYLKLPQEVLTTSMISHQKYFPVLDEGGKLLPHFITINNTLARDPAVVMRGNEKVIRARLSDARFFFDEDQKVSLDKRVNDLDKVTYHTLLGTSLEKVQRFQELADWLAGRIDPALQPTVTRTAWLAKADLDTQMVGEFSELQGIMGREYALLAGENPAVAKGIYEHYLPVAAGGDLPETHEGAIVSLADKMDTICGFFGVNLIPSGTADPYALRRQALGIINILLTKSYAVSLPEIVDKSLDILGAKLQRSVEDTRQDVLTFFAGRFENMLIGQGRPYDVVDAVVAAGFGDLPKALAKIDAMEAFKGHADFQPLAAVFKRVGNILKGFPGGTVAEGLLAAEAEKALYAAFVDIRVKASNLLNARDYAGALREMARLRPFVDGFFEGVMVMDKDEAVRLNRLSLLWEIAALFHRVADFSKLVASEG